MFCTKVFGGREKPVNTYDFLIFFNNEPSCSCPITAHHILISCHLYRLAGTSLNTPLHLPKMLGDSPQIIPRILTFVKTTAFKGTLKKNDIGMLLGNRQACTLKQIIKHYRNQKIKQKLKKCQSRARKEKRKAGEFRAENQPPKRYDFP